MTIHDEYTEALLAQYRIVALTQAARQALEAINEIDERLEADCEEPECQSCQQWRSMWRAAEALRLVLREAR